MSKIVCSNKNRNSQLDMLKGVAILLVMTYHFFYRYVELYEPQLEPCFVLSKWGVIGVTLFLVISGYLMFTSKKSGFQFIIKKLLRLWPAYIVAISICFVVTNIVVLPERTVGVKEFILNLFWINGFVNVAYVDSAHWYITTLIGCIIVYSIIGLFPQEFKWKALVVCEVLCTVLALAIDFLYPSSKVLAFILSLMGGRYLPMLILGSAIKYFQESKEKTNGCMFLMSTVVCNTLMNSIGYSLILMITGIILFLLVKIDDDKLRIPVLGELGKRSYSLFLIHQNIGFCVIFLLSHKFGYSYMFSILVEILMIICGILLYQLVENRFIIEMRFMKK